MVGAFFIEQVIGGRAAEFPLRKLLQQRLVIATQFARGCQLDLGANVGVNELPRSGITTLATGFSPWTQFCFVSSPVGTTQSCIVPTGLDLSADSSPRAKARG